MNVSPFSSPSVMYGFAMEAQDIGLIDGMSTGTSPGSMLYVPGSPLPSYSTEVANQDAELISGIQPSSSTPLPLYGTSGDPVAQENAAMGSILSATGGSLYI